MSVGHFPVERKLHARLPTVEQWLEMQVRLMDF